MYVHTLPTTGAISFSDFLITSRLVAQVSQATELRANLRALLKQCRAADKQSQDASIDWLRIVKAVDDYLPHLFAIFNCIQTDDLILRYEPQFSWRTTLSSSFLRSPPRIALPGIHYEMCSTLLLSGVALSNFAASATASLANYERDRRLSDAERKLNDDKLRCAADTLCRACGIFEHLSQTIIPQWEAQVGRIDGRPPDVTRELTLALSKLALAEAQTLAIRKLLSPSLSLAVDTLTPGPPLPKSHPSPSLLAKLHLNVASHFDSARSLAKTVGKKTTASSKSSDFGSYAPSPAIPSSHHPNIHVHAETPRRDGGDDGDGSGGKKAFGKLRLFASRDASGSSPSRNAAAASLGMDLALDADLEVGPPLLRYMASCAELHRSLAYKWLGVDAGESAGRIGEAIALLRMAKQGLLEGSSSSGGGARLAAALRERGAAAKEARDEIKALREEELRTVEHWLTSYGKVNDTVSFQPIPKGSDLRSRIPAGRAALEPKAYRLPVPAFGPGSPGFRSEGMHRATMLAGDGEGPSAGPADGTAAASTADRTRRGAAASTGATADGGAASDDPDRLLAFGGLSIGKARDEAGQYAGAGAYY